MEKILYRWHSWRIRRARARLDHWLRTWPRYWGAAAVGGGAGVPLGLVDERGAIREAVALGFEVVTVNRNGAFIATRPRPGDRPTEPAPGVTE